MRRTTESTQNGTENFRCAMETQQQAPARALEEVAHVIPSLPRASALDLVNQIWKKNGDLKVNSATASFTKIECKELSFQWADQHHPVHSTQMETEGDEMSSHVSH